MALAPKVAFVVDDDPTAAHLLTQFLGKLGYSAHAFHLGTEALEALDRLRPGVVVCDYNMPRLDGLATLAEIRRRDPDIGRILSTVTPDEAVIRAGLDDETVQVLLVKPVTLKNLVEALTQAALGRGGAIIRFE